METPDSNYKLQRIYAYYRSLLSSLLLLMLYSPMSDQILGADAVKLYLITAVCYCIICWLSLVSIWINDREPSPEKTFSTICFDLFAIILLMHASGGTNSGLGFLLLVSVAAGAISLGRQTSTALAALATILVLGQALYSIQQGDSSRALFSAGTLGFMLFISSFTIYHLSNRIRQSTAEVQEKSAQAAHLQRLAQMIIERMHTGVIVASPSGDIELMNASARKLLPNQNTGTPLSHIHSIPELEEHLQLWRQQPERKPGIIKLPSQQVEARISFAELAPKDSTETLIFVENYQTLTREAQQLKLASLGRLTASIAHEIRNPLGAISHAGQLLAESENLDKGDQRLTEIVSTNTQRINQIIENVMQLSRRRTSNPEVLDLTEWLKSFVRDYCENQVTNADIELILPDKAMPIRADSSHLSQILTNITDNGLRYSELTTGQPTLTIRCTLENELPVLEILDDGIGIPEDAIDQIFEPFFTTEASGSGLGLYLCKQLCEANHAQLSYSKPTGSKSCFKITFAHPDRVF